MWSVCQFDVDNTFAAVSRSSWRGLCQRTAIPRVSVRVRLGHYGRLFRRFPSLRRDDGFHGVVVDVAVLSLLIPPLRWCGSDAMADS